jgi:cytochrome P450
MRDPADFPSEGDPPDLHRSDPFLDRAVLACPHAWYQRSQRSEPVVWVAELGVYLVTRHEDVVRILGDDEAFSSGLEGRIVAALRRNPLRASVRAVLADGFPQVETLPWLDGPEHTRQRAMVSEALTPRRIEALAEPIRTVAGQLVATWPDRGEVDFVEGFAAPFPIAVFAEALGIRQKDRRRFRLWCDGLVRRLGTVPTSQQELAEARKGVQFGRFVGALIDDRRAHPGDDLVSDLVGALAAEGAAASTTELVNLLLVFLMAGTITTQNLLTTLIHELLRRPELLEAVRDEPELRRRAVEETARLHSPVKLFTRVATRDVKVAGTVIPAGEMVLPVFAAANVDPAVWANPLEFRLDRPQPAEHLAFGSGSHACLGAELARAEVLIALDVIFDEYTRIEPAPGRTAQFEPNVWLSVMQHLWLSVRR